MKIISWNVNGIRAAWAHGLSGLLEREKADIFAFQETKTAHSVSYIEMDGYYPYWSFCDGRNGYSGTLCLSRYRPVAVSYDFSIPAGKVDTSSVTSENQDAKDFACEGRIITLEFEKLYLVNCYCPNSQWKKSRQDYRNEWDIRMLRYLRELKKRKMTVVCGDFNVTAADEDIYEGNNWIAQHQEGFQTAEREHFRELLAEGFEDTYRVKNPQGRDYTWWSNRRNKRGENKGWRIDYMLVSSENLEYVEESKMLTDVKGSDHCPLLLELNIKMHESPAATRKPAGLRDIQEAPLEALSKLKADLQHTDLSALWENIDWQKAERHVADMQGALTKAAYTGNMELIAKWQKKIVFSIDAKLIAVRHVASREGGPGVDGIIWMTPHEKMSAALSLTSKGYRSDPARLLIVKSKNGKRRRIHIGTYYDRAMQALYTLSLDPVAEARADRKSFAFRKGRSALDMNEYIKKAFSESDNICSRGRYNERDNDGGDAPPEWAFIADVCQCYEHISHSWILENIPMQKSVLREFLKAGYVFAGELFPADSGVGIGLAISPVIANMVLDGLQGYIYKELYGGEEHVDYPDGNMIRYADDIIVTARTRQTAERIGDIIRSFLKPRGLELSEEKSGIVNINDGFDFMSRTYIKREGWVYVYPAEKAVNRFKHALRETVECHTGSQQSLIMKLNRKLDGLATYHKTVDAAEAFQQIDIYLSAILMELCERKHPKWLRSRILEKYWYRDAFGRYVYAMTDKKETAVKLLADVITVRHNCVKTNVNPYIEADYINVRTEGRASHNVTGVYRSIWNRQQGKCFYCGKTILRDQEKHLIEADTSRKSHAAKMAYVHARCLDSSIDYIDTDTLPDTALDMMELIRHFENSITPAGRKFLQLQRYFYKATKNSITLTFDELEDILGFKLGKSKSDPRYWYRTGFMNISQCWLDNGYEIFRLNTEKEKVTFHLMRKEVSGLDIPESLTGQRIPAEAKYELENYFAYIIKKYGL